MKNPFQAMKNLLLKKNARGELIVSNTGRVLAFLGPLVGLMLTGTIFFLTRDPVAGIHEVDLPNGFIWVPTIVHAPLLGPLQRILNLSTAEEEVLQHRFLHMPGHTWPTADEPMPATAPSARLLYWGLLSMLLSASVCIFGTLILVCRRPDPTPTPVEEGFQQVEMEPGGVDAAGLILHPISTAFMTGTAVFCHLLLVTRMTLQGAFTGRLTSDFGADYELYVTVLLYLCLWLLLQALTTRILWSGLLGPVGRFGPTAFCDAAAKIIVPFATDPFDTVKDAVFAGMALNYGGWAGSFIGWFSLAYLWLLHGYLLWGTGSRTELANVYLTVLLLAPERRPAPGIAPTGAADDDAAKHTKSCPWLLQQLFVLTTPQKQHALLVEDGPQSVLAVLFQATHGFQVQVAIMNLGIPLLRLALSVLVYPMIARRAEVQHWLATNWNVFEAECNDTKASFYAQELGEAVQLLPKEEAAGVAADLVKGPLHDLHMVGYKGFQTCCLLLRCSGPASASASALSSQITVLMMNDWLLGVEGAVGLAADLPLLPALRELNLGGNNLGPEGVAIIAAVFPQLQQLQVLHLGRNHIGDGGMASLAAALPHLQELRDLTLSSNDLGPTGAAIIAAELPRLPALATFSLRANDLGEGEEVVRRAWKGRSGELFF